MRLDKLSDDEILAFRFCDLDLKIEGTSVEDGIRQLYEELDANNIIFRPDCYLADEWLCPDGEPVIGIAFYLAHPRLKKLEYKMMLEVEGGTKTSFMQLLRHETGHAINYAYLLHRRKRWKDLFGPFSAEYPEKYKYRPYSKSFVRHLGEWYAQYHPDEDFAETFAVWLDPESNWREKYKGWKALDKLNYVDRLMKTIDSKGPRKSNGSRHWVASRMKTRLGNHYKKRQKLYAENYPDFHDFYLNKIFIPPSGEKSPKKAYKLLREHRKELLKDVASSTGERKYRISRLLKELVGRSKDQGLEVGSDEKGAVVKTAIYVTAQIMNYLYTGRYKRKR